MALTLPEDHRGIKDRILFCPSEERTARELQQLPKGEREKVWADMTGNPETIYYRIHAERPELVCERLEALENELKGQQEDYREAFDLAVKQNADYVHRQKIRFLRADDFDPAAAAARMVAHFNLKLDLFGSDLLGRDIRLDDLSDDDLESLRGGGMQLLQVPDHATRGVVFTRARNYVYKDRQNILRAFFYTAQCIMEHEHFQKVGLVSVSYQVGGYPKGGYDFELTRKVSQLVQATPIRFVAIYVCYSSSPWQRVADLISHLVSPLLRVRLRSVQGSHQECLYKLMALGVPHHAVPISKEGESLMSNHWQWIESRRQHENADMIVQ